MKMFQIIFLWIMIVGFASAHSSDIASDNLTSSYGRFGMMGGSYGANMMFFGWIYGILILIILILLVIWLLKQIKKNKK